jgi:hypothetical protein
VTRFSAPTGSVTTLVAGVLTAHGFRVGAYLSPARLRPQPAGDRHTGPKAAPWADDRGGRLPGRDRDGRSVVECLRILAPAGHRAAARGDSVAGIVSATMPASSRPRIGYRPHPSGVAAQETHRNVVRGHRGRAMATASCSRSTAPSSINRRMTAWTRAVLSAVRGGRPPRAARNRTRFRAARPRAVRPPPSAYLMTPA